MSLNYQRMDGLKHSFTLLRRKIEMFKNIWQSAYIGARFQDLVNDPRLELNVKIPFITHGRSL